MRHGRGKADVDRLVTDAKRAVSSMITGNSPCPIRPRSTARPPLLTASCSGPRPVSRREAGRAYDGVVAGTNHRFGRAHELALAFLADAYEGVATPAGKGLPHAQSVAEVLAANGYDAQVQLVALLHDVVEDTSCTVSDVGAIFGNTVAEMVGTLSEDGTVTSYARRKRALREKIAAAGRPVVDVALADKIAILRHAQMSGTTVPKRKLAHYQATLELAAATDEGPRLRPQLEALLAAVSGSAGNTRLRGADAAR